MTNTALDATNGVRSKASRTQRRVRYGHLLDIQSMPKHACMILSLQMSSLSLQRRHVHSLYSFRSLGLLSSRVVCVRSTCDMGGGVRRRGWTRRSCRVLHTDARCVMRPHCSHGHRGDHPHGASLRAYGWQQPLGGRTALSICLCGWCAALSQRLGGAFASIVGERERVRHRYSTWGKKYAGPLCGEVTDHARVRVLNCTVRAAVIGFFPLSHHRLLRRPA